MNNLSVHLGSHRFKVVLAFASIYSGCGHRSSTKQDTVPVEFRRGPPIRIKDMPVGSTGRVTWGYCVDAEFHVRLNPNGWVRLESSYYNLERKADGYWFTPSVASVDDECTWPIVARIVK